MRWFVVLCVLTEIAFAQANLSSGALAGVRVCVATPANLSSLRVSPEAQREWLLRAINADGRKPKIKVEALPVRAGDAGREDARDQNCRFILTLHFEETYGYVPKYPTPYTPAPATKREESAGTRRASLMYLIERVDNASRVDGGEIPLRMGGDDEAAASRAMSQLSPRVVHDAAHSQR